MTEEKKEGEKETIEIDKELYLSMIGGPDPEKEDRAAELGLIELWIYHCNRCNYTWLPKDFDYRGNNNILFDMELPKSCARCKSKYWNKTPQRETKNSGKMYSVARFRALRRTQYGSKKSEDGLENWKMGSTTTNKVKLLLVV